MGNSGNKKLRAREIGNNELRVEDIRNSKLRGGEVWNSELRVEDIRNIKLREREIGNSKLLIDVSMHSMYISFVSFILLYQHQ